jgi:N-acetylneuraminic acid mutarotase
VLQLTLHEVDIYDFKTNTWTTLDASKNIPTPRAGATAIAYKGKVLVIGGESTAHVEAHNEVEAYDVKKNVWEKWAKLSTTRHGTQVVQVKGKLYIGAGSKNRGGGPELNTVEVLEK